MAAENTVTCDTNQAPCSESVISLFTFIHDRGEREVTVRTVLEYAESSNFRVNNESYKIGPILSHCYVLYQGHTVTKWKGRTALGAVSGRRLNLLNTIVEEYIGIPYAKPPVGDLRFMPPVPMEPWEGTYNATQTRTGCPQIPIPGIWAGEVTYTEDCLHPNVWTSRPPMNDSEASAQLSPVLAWIHGGGFCLGSAAYDNYTGSILAAKTGFVVVSMNYRLGVLGFMDARFPGAPGNMGLMDQNLALRWIQKNARFFGGDPAKVTLFGESAGAMSINCHLLSPMSERTFRSGSST
ncbi:hypothetical protein HPB48_021487 [Haemaphysalis longicornis]|uniref:Carboxylic ester hydrolase n=1 Tax=Haemaphysalis longicornis TaxID=44386 RepID=A0A9J6GKB9_HAELO|nr:hypothetical protein HPB48_021487 [Haemaphysalis longicornis]